LLLRTRGVSQAENRSAWQAADGLEQRQTLQFIVGTTLSFCAMDEISGSGAAPVLPFAIKLA
jgi:hypothetical protein